MINNSVVDDHTSWVNRVLGADHTTRVAIKHMYPVDTDKYEWVDLYLRDKLLRNKIDLLKVKKRETLNFPIHRDELKEIFINGLKRNQAEKISSIRGYVVLMQQRTVVPPLKLDSHLLLDLSDNEINEIFSQVPDGVRQNAIDNSVKETEKEIAKLEEKIRLELSPPSRWLYKQDGSQLPYPMGCRWTIFVKDWEKVASRYNGGVNIEGGVLESSEEKEAYYALEIDKVYRISPTRDPKERY